MDSEVLKKINEVAAVLRGRARVGIVFQMSKRTRIWLGPAGPAGHTERPAASGISARGVQGWEPHRWSCHVLTQGHVMEGGGPGLDAASASCGHQDTALALCPRGSPSSLSQATEGIVSSSDVCCCLRWTACSLGAGWPFLLQLSPAQWALTHACRPSLVYAWH